MIFIAVVYITLALLIAWIGRRRSIGFAGVFVLAIVLTPPITAMILLITSPNAIG